MVRTTRTPDLLQVIEMDLPQLGVREESFRHRDERKGKQVSLDGAVASIVEESILPLLWLFCHVMSYIWSWALCVQNHNRNTLFLKITSGKHNLSKCFSNA